MVRKEKTSAVIRFTAELEKMSGRFAWTYVEFPFDVQELFGKKGSVRIKGTINGVSMDRALMPTKSGYHIIVLGSELPSTRTASRRQRPRPLNVASMMWCTLRPRTSDTCRVMPAAVANDATACSAS